LLISPAAEFLVLGAALNASHLKDDQ
jgi:hypothetical protein